jgi:hypothetical protein
VIASRRPRFWGVSQPSVSGAALLTAATLWYSCTDAAPTAPASAAVAPDAAPFLSRIADSEHTDPNSPAALDARFEYADFLVALGPRACGQRLDLAQSQLDTLAANPASQVIFPDGSARAADLEYRIHLGRASCATDPAVRARESQAALETAQLAVRLNRDAFDYPAMAVAQFNVAATYQSQRSDTDAIGALETAIAMDREFGLTDDARGNYALLFTWRKQPSGPEQVAQQMRDFPSRSANLKFAWTARAATVAITRSNAGVVDNKVIHAQGSRVFERQVRAQEGGWAVSYVASSGTNDFGVWPRELFADGPPALFRPTLLQFPNFQVTAAGDFQSVSDLAGFAMRVTSDAETEIRAGGPNPGRGRALIGAAIRSAQNDFAPQVIAQNVAENYELETAMWIGATLQQGVHYELVAPLALAGIPFDTVNHRLDFVFTRELPCPSGLPAHPCVELIVHATPEGQPLRQWVGSDALDYSSSVSVRIITDPQTLQPYLRDTRRFWYMTLGQKTSAAKVVIADHSLITTTYPEP